MSAHSWASSTPPIRHRMRVCLVVRAAPECCRKWKKWTCQGGSAHQFQQRRHVHAMSLFARLSTKKDKRQVALNRTSSSRSSLWGGCIMWDSHFLLL